jgi:2-amino-4-hydroxy-6-hydroxymethyldihydropteridine diphosphokinase
MTPIPRPHIRMPAASPASASAPAPAPSTAPSPALSPAEGSHIDPPGVREGRSGTPQEEKHGGAAVVLALGSNLGDRSGTIADAIRALGALPGLDLTGVSSLYESAAVKPNGIDADAPSYLNAVVTARYDGTPAALLDAVNRIEADHGRQRVERWGDRTLDIDIILFGESVISDARLTVPHPRAAERDFVLIPWLEIDAEAVLPGHGRADALLARIHNTVRSYPGGGR